MPITTLLGMMECSLYSMLLKKNLENMIEEQTEVGRETGDAAVVAARVCGLIPVLGKDADLLEDEKMGEVEENGLVGMSYEDYREARKGIVQNQAEDEADNVDENDQPPPRTEMYVIAQAITRWVNTGETLLKSNTEHRVCIFTCVLHLAYAFCGVEREEFSMVVQGSGGTGKTMSIIVAVKEFISVVTEVSGVAGWEKYFLLLGPTNVVALAIGGKTIDSGVFNRRHGTGKPLCSKYVKLMIVDEFSMVTWVGFTESMRL